MLSVFLSEQDYRFEGLHTREVRDLELIEHYVGRSDGLSSMKVTFSNPQGENATAIAATREKKFGPAAERSTQPLKEVVKIVERFEEPKKQDVVEKDEKDQELDNEENRRDEEESPGRVLNPDRIMERVFDLDNERILIKFHREGGQIFCRTVSSFSDNIANMTEVRYIYVLGALGWISSSQQECSCRHPGHQLLFSLWVKGWLWTHFWWCQGI